MNRLLCFVSLAAAGAAGAAGAAEPALKVDAKVREGIARVAPGAAIDAVASSVVPGFHEVVIGREVVYVSADGHYVFAGPLLDTEQGRDLTEIRKAAIRKTLLDAFPDEARVTFPAEAEKYRVTVFTDVDCGYCRRMHQDIAEYSERGITVDYLFYPRSGPATDAFAQAVAVTCADDKALAFTRALAGEKLAPSQCASPVQRSFDAALAIGASGTPMAYLADGRLVGGYLTPDQMVARLEQMAATP